MRLLLAAFTAIAALLGSLIVGITAGGQAVTATTVAAAEQAQSTRALGAARTACATQGAGALLAANAARAAGFPDTPAPEAPGYTHLEIAVAVAGQESSYDPQAGNQLADGRTHRGLWQLSSLHLTDLRINPRGGDLRYDPAENARMAYRLWQQVGQRWHPTWSAFTDGGFSKYLDDARAAVRGTAGVPSCAIPDAPLNDAGDQPRTARARAALQQAYGPLEIGGKREKSRGRGHMNGHALDVMTYEDRRLGWQIVAFVQTHAEALGVEYIIFEQQIWYPGHTDWDRMGDRGSVTENHYDHPHIEFLPG